VDVDAFLETSRVVGTGVGVEVVWTAMTVNAHVHKTARDQGYLMMNSVGFQRGFINPAAFQVQLG
jgi:hypothetical protein